MHQSCGADTGQREEEEEEEEEGGGDEGRSVGLCGGRAERYME